MTDISAHFDLTNLYLYPRITMIAENKSFDAIRGVDNDGSSHFLSIPSEIVNMMNTQIR